MLYLNTGVHEMKNNTLGTPDEVFTNLQRDRCGKVVTWDIGLDVEMKQFKEEIVSP
jgi:hypothetical protein